MCLRINTNMSVVVCIGLDGLCWQVFRSEHLKHTLLTHMRIRWANVLVTSHHPVQKASRSLAVQVRCPPVEAQV